MDGRPHLKTIYFKIGEVDEQVEFWSDSSSEEVKGGTFYIPCTQIVGGQLPCNYSIKVSSPLLMKRGGGLNFFRNSGGVKFYEKGDSAI